MNRPAASTLFTAATALVFGFGGAALHGWSGLGHRETRAYLLDNPQILQDMAKALQRQDTVGRLDGIAQDVHAPFPGAILGNPQGKQVLVEFTDYGCGYCRRSVAELDAMIADNPDLKVVIREWPIFEGSDLPARMALAAAKQGKFEAFHKAMFARESISPEAVRSAAVAAGLDLAQAEHFAASQEAEFEIMKNRGLAQKLGFEGTPSWVAGEEILFGAVGRKVLGEAVARAYGS